MRIPSLFQPVPPPAPFLEKIRKSPSAPVILGQLRRAVPDVSEIPQTTYGMYREFARSGERAGYEHAYFVKRSMLTRAVVETLLKTGNYLDRIHDLAIDICEETTWVLPAHEQQAPSAKHDAFSAPRPEFIDLFAAETGAGLAETVFLLGDQMEREVAERIRREMDRRIFQPYLANSRASWWHVSDSNWNAVCNGAVGLAFLRLEDDSQRLSAAVQMLLEGLEAYIGTGFESDGGSLEGISYWQYGLLFFSAFAELLMERAGVEFDLLSDLRLAAAARFPLAMSLGPGRFINFGDADANTFLHPGIVSQLARRTGVDQLAGLLRPPGETCSAGYAAAKLPIVLRDIAWWDGTLPGFPKMASEDHFLPACAVMKLTGCTAQGRPVFLSAKAGSNDGHHHHMDIGHFIVTFDGEDLLCDPGRGRYSREYFSQRRFENPFCSSLGHSVPKIGNCLQRPGPRFGESPQARGEIVAHGRDRGSKFVLIEMAPVYFLASLKHARRKLALAESSGDILLVDTFDFSGDPLNIEEAFITWNDVSVQGSTVFVSGCKGGLALNILEPSGANVTASLLGEGHGRADAGGKILTRIAAALPPGTTQFVMQIVPLDKPRASSRPDTGTRRSRGS
jgi:hypothetical protein